MPQLRMTTEGWPSCVVCLVEEGLGLRREHHRMEVRRRVLFDTTAIAVPSSCSTEVMH